MKVRFKKLKPSASSPEQAHNIDAGYDLRATSISVDNDGNVVYGTGLAIEIPVGYVGLVFPRSSISKKNLFLTNCVGVIDPGYTGEITFKFKTTDNKKLPEKGLNDLIKNMYNVGDKIGQIIIIPRPDIEFIEANELNDSERGDGGYGSTGR